MVFSKNSSPNKIGGVESGTGRLPLDAFEDELQTSSIEEEDVES